MGVEEHYFLAVLAAHLEGGDVDDRLGVFTEQPAGRLLLFADDEVDEEAFADLLGAQEGHDVKIGVVLVEGQVVNEVFIGFQLACGLIECQHVHHSVGCFVGWWFGVIEGGVLLELLVGGDGGE